MKRTLGTLLAVLWCATGCAPLTVSQPVITDDPVRSEERPLPAGAVEATFEQTGTDVTAHLRQICNIERVDIVQRTTVRRYENAAPQNDVWAGVGGALIAGAGATMVASPSTFRGEDSKLSAKETQGVGYGAIGVGAALLAIPVIDYFRSHREAERKVERVEEPGPIVARSKGCGAPPAGTKVLAALGGRRTLLLGEVDSQGSVRFDLDRVVPSDLAFEKDDSATLQVGTFDVAAVPLSSLYDARDQRAWSLLADGPCLTADTEAGCDGEVQYARRFRSGMHADEARARWAAAQARRLAAEEERAYAALDLDACRKSHARSSSEVASACRPLEAFVVAHPGSSHLADLDGALKAGSVTRDRLVAKEAAATSYAPPGQFIAYEGNGGGPTLCADGMVSHSSGRGTCSHHGGIAGGSSRSRGRSKRR